MDMEVLNIEMGWCGWTRKRAEVPGSSPSSAMYLPPPPVPMGLSLCLSLTYHKVVLRKDRLLGERVESATTNN